MWGMKMKKHRVIYFLLVILAVSLLAGCAKGSDENERGLSFYAGGEYEKAAEAFAEAVAADNREPEYYRNRAMALIKLGRYEEAKSCLDLADQLEPDTMAGERARGILCYEQGLYESALFSFEKAISLSSGKVGETEVDILCYTADCQMALERYNDAISTYTRLINAGNTSTSNYYLRGTAYLKSGNASDAGMDFNRVVESGSYEEYWKVYSLLAEYGQQEMADQFLSKAVLLEGSSDSDHVWRGEFHYYLGNYDEAIAEFNAASQNVIDVDIYLMMAHIYMEKGDTNRVKAAFSMAESKAPNNPYLIYQETLFWMRTGDYEEAYELIEAGMALSDNPYRQQMHYCQAGCLEYLGRFGEALTAFREYVNLYGSNEEIDHEIAFLETRVDTVE